MDKREPNEKWDEFGFKNYKSAGDNLDPLREEAKKRKKVFERNQEENNYPFDPKPKREFSLNTNTSKRATNIDIDFHSKYSQFYQKLENFYKGDVKSLNWVSIIKDHSAKYVNDNPLYKYSKVVDKDGKPMITFQDIEDYEKQLIPDVNYSDAVLRYNHEKKKLLSTFKHDQLDRLRKQFSENPFLSDYIESQGNADGLFELNEDSSIEDNNKIVDEMNR